MSIASEITRLQNAKADLKTAIEAKGITVGDNDTIDTYASKVEGIETGGESVGKLALDNCCYFCYGGARTDLLDKIDTSNCTNFSYMFYNCRTIDTIPELDTANGTNFSCMFYDTNIKTIPELNTSNGTNFRSMFYNCSYLTDIPNIDTSKGKDTGRMFYRCSAITSIPELNLANSTDVIDMFSGCSNLKVVPKLNIPKVKSLQRVFDGCNNLTTVTELDVSNVTAFADVFSGCNKLTNVKLLNINANLTINSSSLTVDSLVGLLYELWEAPGNGVNYTLNIGATNIAKLEDVYIRITFGEITDEMREKDPHIDKKLPFVVCDKTDSRAYPILNYPSLKFWQLV